MKSRLKLVKPDAENRAVAPTRLANSKYRSREHLTPSEVEKLIEVAKTEPLRWLLCRHADPAPGSSGGDTARSLLGIGKPVRCVLTYFI